VLAGRVDDVAVSDDSSDLLENPQNLLLVHDFLL
jgi:hypothetical protein